MSVFSALISTRKNSRPPSVPTTGTSRGTPAASRWASVSEPRADGDDADALAGRQGRLNPGHLHQRGGGDRHVHRLGQLALEQRKEAAIGGDRLGAEIDEVARRGDEVRQEPPRTLQHDPFGIGAAHHPEQHGERPGRAIAHVAGDARESAPPA